MSTSISILSCSNVPATKAATAAAPASSAQAQTTSTPRTTLQKHIDFFDRNHDGQITMSETYEGLRALHLSRAKASLAAAAINGTLGPATSTHWWDPTTIDTSRINLAKHGSDTGIIDANGQFVQAKFDEMFNRFDVDHDGVLNDSEITTMRTANKTDSAGSLASKAEFDLLLEIAGEDRQVNGQTVRVLTRDTMTALYDGTLFYRIAGEPVPQS